MSRAIYQEIVDAVAKLATASLPTMAVYSRRRSHLIDRDKVPCVVVSFSTEGERVMQECFGGIVWYAYPVVVMCVAAGNETATLRYPAEPDEKADRETIGHTEARETLRDALFQTTLTDVASVFNCDPPAMGPPFRLMAKDQSLYLVAMMTMTYWSNETRAV